MGGKNDKVTVSLDGRPCEVPADATILEAARRAGVYIPTLCTHEGLLPFGACRMCLVEVEGIRGFPTACTTPVQNGMVIRTDTESVRRLRLEVLRLTLSHHPCGCIVCAEGEACRTHSETTRKAGVTTGCRTCPNDGACELQDVVERLGLEDIGLPVYYRGLRVEKDDPFYDRDYNLCILCGRCVRICQDLHGAGTLAFQNRGVRTIVGPAYGRTHMESGCEFCGACVAACPTGALSEKVRKWDGAPDREVVTTCPLCGVGCRIKLLVKSDRIMGSLPVDVPSHGGELCVKGRFCVPEIVNDHRRLKRPYAVERGVKTEIAWDRAIEIAAEKIVSCRPGRFAMLVSPNCTNEDLYVAEKFARAAVRSNRVDTSARTFYGAGFKAYLDLLKRSAPLSEIGKASAILAVGLDTRFARSGVGVALRSALRRGAKLVTIHPHPHNLSFIADEWLRPEAGATGGALESFAAAKLLREAASPLILVGPEALHEGKSARILEIIEKLAREAGAGVVALPAQNNLYGSILMGAYPELLPGGYAFSDEGRRAAVEKAWGVNLPDHAPSWTGEFLRSAAQGGKLGALPDAPGRGTLDVLYLVGEVPKDERPPAGFVVYQNVSPPPRADYADLVLPAASFAEADGTFLGGDGRLRRVRKAVDPPGEARPDWEILSRIARKMDVKGFDFEDVRAVHGEIAELVGGFGDFDALETEPLPFVCDGDMSAGKDAAADGKSSREISDANAAGQAAVRDAPGEAVVGNAADDARPFVLSVSIEEHTYRGFPISEWVGGAREIFPDGCVDMSALDAEDAGVRDGDDVFVWGAGFERVWRARIVEDQIRGSLRVTLREQDGFGWGPLRVNMRKHDVRTP